MKGLVHTGHIFRAPGTTTFASVVASTSRNVSTGSAWNCSAPSCIDEAINVLRRKDEHLMFHGFQSSQVLTRVHPFTKVETAGEIHNGEAVSAALEAVRQAKKDCESLKLELLNEKETKEALAVIVSELPSLNGRRLLQESDLLGLKDAIGAYRAGQNQRNWKHFIKGVHERARLRR